MQQVLDGLLHADDLVEHAPLGRRQVGGLRVRLVDLELGAHAGERAPQLVGGIGDEALLLDARVLDPLEHVVHRPGQPGDLVVTRWLGHPPVEVGAADLRDLGADGLDRSQRPPDEEPDPDARAALSSTGTVSASTLVRASTDSSTSSSVAARWSTSRHRAVDRPRQHPEPSRRGGAHPASARPAPSDDGVLARRGSGWRRRPRRRRRPPGSRRRRRRTRPRPGGHRRSARRPASSPAATAIDSSRFATSNERWTRRRPRTP